MKKLILYIFLIIIIPSAISQTIYPKEIVLGKDSLVAFTYNQVRVINSDLEELQGCRSMLDTMDVLVLKYDSLLKDGTDLVLNLKSQLILKDGIINDKNNIIDLKEKEYKKLLTKKKTGEIVLWTGVSIGIATSIGLLIWATTK